jgi:phosphatidylglycerophosphate synthase
VRATAAEARGASLRVAGLTVLERALKQLRRQGRLVVLAADGTIPLPAPLPAGVEVRPVSSAAELEPLAHGAAVVAADVVRPSNRALDGGIRVIDEASRRQAEDAIFAELLRGDLGLVARYLNKPLSFRFTRYVLCRLPFTPNQVTLGAALVGLAGCALIASGHHLAMFAGFVLAHVQSVLDGCDGELARVRFQQSPIGEWLDTIVDDGLNLALVFSIGVGVSRLTGSPWPVLVGMLTAAMLLTYNAVAYRELMRQGEGGEVLKVRWWFNRGNDLKGLYGASSPRAIRVLIGVCRRDFFLFAWPILAAVGLFGLIQIYALAVAAPSFVVAVGQLITSRSR